MLTIDASVIVAASLDSESATRDARAFLGAAGASGLPIHEPVIALVEVAASVIRRTGSRELVAAGMSMLVGLPGVTFHALDIEAATTAVTCAVDFGLRAGDAAYVGVARSTFSTLVTFDKELLACASETLDVTTPSGWLARTAA